MIFLQALPQITLTDVARPPTDAHPDLIADLVIGPYKLIRELGFGGMGAVWLAERTDGLKKSSHGALEQAILATETERPSTKIVAEAQAKERATTLPRLKKTLAGDLDTIVLKALKKSPAERYATVDAFAQDIQRYVANEPILTRADSKLYRLRKFVARNKVALGAAAAVVLALTAGLMGTLTQARPGAGSFGSRRECHRLLYATHQ